jgi:signal transduction histidine kinase
MPDHEEARDAAAETGEAPRAGEDPLESPDAARREVEVRALQQETVAQLGLSAIVASDLQAVLDQVVATATDTLGVTLAKVLQLEPGGDSFLLRAGTGWRGGLVGEARIPVSESQGGYSLQTDGPVIVEDLRDEERLMTPQLLLDHGVISGMTVLIQSKQGTWGVLGVHSRSRRRFTPNDVHFLQALANVVTAVLERERVEEELRRSRAELAMRVADDRLRRSERLASLGTLAAGIAHEINNPVNTILMTAESALSSVRNGGGNGRLSEDLSVVVHEAERCGEIVRKTLEFVREQRPARREENLSEVARSAVTMAQKALRTPAVEIGVELADDLPPVLLNRAEIEQAVIHLIRNALESGTEGEPPAVTVRTARHADRVAIAVEDDGVGVDPEVRDRIFDPFFTTRRDKGGAGLGLSLAHSIVTDHGGTIEVESEPGEGSVFRIELPAAGPAGS